MAIRSIDRLNRHLERTVGNCGNGYVSILRRTDDGYNYKAVRLSCKSYLCPRCRSKAYLNLRRRLNEAIIGVDYSFWTFTVPFGNYHSPEGIQSLCKLWDTFLKALKRQYPSIKYIRILELQKSGNPHFHILFNRYLNFNFVREQWTRITTGTQVNFKKIDSHNIIKYLSKYLSNTAKNNITFEEVLYQSGVRRFSGSIGLMKPLDKDASIIHVSFFGNSFSNLPPSYFIDDFLSCIHCDETSIKNKSPSDVTIYAPFNDGWYEYAALGPQRRNQIGIMSR